jgi:uncharacterized protein (UPF0262 family)
MTAEDSSAASHQQIDIASDLRICAIHLDEATIIRRSDDIEQERRVAIFDLLEGNYFRPLRLHPDGYAGPYQLYLKVEDGRLILDIRRDNDQALEIIILALGRFRRLIREYFAICDSYFQAVRTSTAAQIEAVDMARRGLHNQAAELLVDALNGKVELDFDTARRLFTLICVLHIKG